MSQLTDLKLMIILIEGEYPACKRNTPFKMKALLLEEFDVNVSENEILCEYGLIEDYEMENNKVEYGINNY